MRSCICAEISMVIHLLTKPKNQRDDDEACDGEPVFEKTAELFIAGGAEADSQDFFV